MSSNFTSLKTVPISISFKEYYLVNGWGWFVDIENSEPIKQKQHFYGYKQCQCVIVPKPIKEYPIIRSMKSIKNLHEISNKFDINDDKDKKQDRTNNSSYCNIITHTIGLIGIVICCYYITI